MKFLTWFILFSEGFDPAPLFLGLAILIGGLSLQLRYNDQKEVLELKKEVLRLEIETLEAEVE